MSKRRPKQTGFLRSLASDYCVSAWDADVAYKRKRPKVAELFLEPCPHRKGDKVPKSKLWTYTPKNEMLLGTVFCLDADAGYR